MAQLKALDSLVKTTEKQKQLDEEKNKYKSEALKEFGKLCASSFDCEKKTFKNSDEIVLIIETLVKNGIVRNKTVGKKTKSPGADDE